MIQIVKKSGAKLRVLYESGGVIFIFSGMIFWFWVSRSWGNATPCLYSLTFSGSIQAQNLCKSLAGVRWFKVCGACMRKFCTKEKIPHPA